MGLWNWDTIQKWRLSLLLFIVAATCQLMPLLPNQSFNSTRYVRVRNFMANSFDLLLRTPGPVPIWDLHVFYCRDQSLLNLSCFRTFEFRTSLGTSLSLSFHKLSGTCPLSALSCMWYGFVHPRWRRRKTLSGTCLNVGAYSTHALF